MSYEVVYGQGALDQLLALNLPEIADCVESAMGRLADDPYQHSRRGARFFLSRMGGSFGLKNSTSIVTKRRAREFIVGFISTSSRLNANFT